ncbi:hypothetical protein [Pontibacter litorisediminis]|uniref:hypothetical protein n=1 Tax=Pontibacter litorisediminis TaxID=1846260 RepID=UPI0023ECF216|nr:hypothetical protein [Pontibacter litorisediminis]
MDEKVKRFYKVMSDFKKVGLIKTCFHHKKEECNGAIKQAHSVQRNGRLSIIEGEVNGNMCVYTFTSGIPNEKSPIADLKPIGKKEASTFFGFCDYHDSKLFSDIENNQFDGSDKHLFLHSYRSFAHSYHRKNEEVKVYNNPDSEFVKILPPKLVETMKKGGEQSLNELNERKKQLDIYLESEDYSVLNYLVYEKEGLYPFAVSSQMGPKVSYRNKPMNNHNDYNVPFSQLMVTMLPDVNKTFVVLAAFPDDAKAINLLDELDQLEDLELERAITSLIIANCENTFFSPSFWNSLSKSEKERLLLEVEMNTSSPMLHDHFFKSHFNFFDSKYKV